MANTYTQLYIHLVFAVKNRQALINSVMREETERYMIGILLQKKHKLLAIHLMPDHAHILIGANPSVSLSETVKVPKVETTNFIREKRFTPFEFSSNFSKMPARKMPFLRNGRRVLRFWATKMPFLWNGWAMRIKNCCDGTVGR